MSPSSRRLRPVPVALALSLVSSACAGGRFAEVSPEEIPALQEHVSRNPDNGDLVLRLSAALFAAGRCDTAVTVARSGMALAPSNAVGPLVVGQCLEQAGQPGEAGVVYRSFIARHGDARGAGAVRAREMLTAREEARRDAREVLAREEELADVPGDPQTLAVLPVAIAGDSSYAPLSRGLAQILTSDLALLQRFRMVERILVNALLDELELAETGRVDPTTAARAGRLMRAGRLVQGLASIPTEANVRLEASVIRSTGEVTAPAVVDGRFRDLLVMEKDLVIGLAGRLGHQLSEAERRRILENGTQNLTAFLAYSRGLVAEDFGDYNAAAQHYGQAARNDPNFQAARQRFQATQAAPRVQQASASQVTTVAGQQPAGPVLSPTEALGSSLGAIIGDLAPTVAEQTAPGAQTTQQATTTTASSPPPIAVTPPATLTATIRIVFRLP